MDLKGLGSLNQPATLNQPKAPGAAVSGTSGGMGGAATASVGGTAGGGGVSNAGGSSGAAAGPSTATVTLTRVAATPGPSQNTGGTDAAGTARVAAAVVNAADTASLAAIARSAGGVNNGIGVRGAGVAGLGAGVAGSGAGVAASGAGIVGFDAGTAAAAAAAARAAAAGAGTPAGSIAAAIARATGAPGATTTGAGALSSNPNLTSLIANGGPLPGGPQKGIEVYLQLINSVATDQSHEKSAALLTTGLQTASSALRSAFYEAAFRLPADLAAKDWKFSIANGSLVFTAGQDDLSTQDLAMLRTVLGGANVESAAKQVAGVIISIVQMRKAGADPGSMAWLRLDVDESNFGDRVDLRSYTTATAPGSLYQPNATTYSAAHSQVPAMLGGMDLRELVTARPKFLRADGSVSPEALEEFDFDLPVETPQVSTTLHGQCSCGQVRFIVDDEFEYAFYCHCSRCRARTGSVFAAIAGITVDKLAVIAGHEHLLLEGECSDGYGARCSRCFSFMFAAVRGRQYLHVSLGSLLDSPGRVPDHHIYVGSKAPWYQITDSLAQYDELPDGG